MLPECIVLTVKHGNGSVLVWGCFSLSRTGDLVKINGIMRKENYKLLLEQNALFSSLRLIGDNFVFTQDNPKHTSLLCKNYLLETENGGILKLMTWWHTESKFKSGWTLVGWTW